MNVVRRIGSVAILGAVNQGVVAICGVLAYGVIARRLPAEQFGMFMTVVACGTWFQALGMGQNSVILTRVSAAASTDLEEARRLFAASATIVFAASAAAALLVLAIAPLAPWSDWLNARAIEPRSLVTQCVIACFLLSTLTGPSLLAGSAIFAHQRGALMHIFMMAGYIGALALTFAAAIVEAPLWILLLASISAPVLGGGALWVYGASTRLTPARISFDRERACDSLRAGSLFLLIDIAIMLVLRTPEFVVAKRFGPVAAAQAAAACRMSFLVFTALAAALQPFWPVIVNAIQRGDCAWIKRAAAWTFGLTIAAWSVAAVCTLALGEAIIGIWLGSAEFATPGMMLALCVQMLGLAVMAWGLVLLGALAMQAWHLIALLASALVYLIASATMSETFGAEGVLMAQGIALTTLFTPLAVYAVWRRIGVLEHGAARAAQAAA